MPKRITFQADRESTVCEIDNYCRVKKVSRSAVISNLLNALSPMLERVNDRLHQVNSIEVELNQLLRQKDCLLPRSQPNMTLEEHVYRLWLNVIRHQEECIDFSIHEHTQSKPKMGKSEITLIKEMLDNIVSQLSVERNIERAVFIYTDRQVSHQFKRAGGLSHTLFIKQSECDGYFFDFANSQPLPTFDVITHGIKVALEKNQVVLSIPSICWIPIFYVGNTVIMTPVIKFTDVKKQTLTMDKTIIINLFRKEIKT